MLFLTLNSLQQDSLFSIISKINELRIYKKRVDKFISKIRNLMIMKIVKL